MNEHVKPQWTDHLKTLAKDLETKVEALDAKVSEDLKPKEPKANA